MEGSQDGTAAFSGYFVNVLIATPLVTGQLACFLPWLQEIASTGTSIVGINNCNVFKASSPRGGLKYNALSIKLNPVNR